MKRTPNQWMVARNRIQQCLNLSRGDANPIALTFTDDVIIALSEAHKDEDALQIIKDNLPAGLRPQEDPEPSPKEEPKSTLQDDREN